MRLVLGCREYDVATRALVVGVVGASAAVDAVLAEAERMVAEGADAVEVGGDLGAGLAATAANDDAEAAERVASVVAALCGRLGAPVVVATPRAAVAEAALRAGAAAVRDGGGGGPAYLAAVARAGATAVLAPGGRPGGVVAVRDALAERVRQAEAAGVRPGRVVVEAPAELPVLLRGAARLAVLGHPLAVSATEEEPAAVVALGVGRGARWVRAVDVRSASRARDVLRAILEAR